MREPLGGTELLRKSSKPSWAAQKVSAPPIELLGNAEVLDAARQISWATQRFSASPKEVSGDTEALYVGHKKLCVAQMDRDPFLLLFCRPDS